MCAKWCRWSTGIPFVVDEVNCAGCVTVEGLRSRSRAPRRIVRGEKFGHSDVMEQFGAMGVLLRALVFKFEAWPPSNRD